MSGNYGHKMNTEITDNGNDDGAGTPGIESAAENEDNTTRTSHSTHSHYVLPGAKSKVRKYFAFEADDDNKILNNSVVICQVENYNTRIGYSKNATNLSLLLKRHHPTQHSEIHAVSSDNNSGQAHCSNKSLHWQARITDSFIQYNHTGKQIQGTKLAKKH